MLYNCTQVATVSVKGLTRIGRGEIRRVNWCQGMRKEEGQARRTMKSDKRERRQLLFISPDLSPSPFILPFAAPKCHFGFPIARFYHSGFHSYHFSK